MSIGVASGSVLLTLKSEVLLRGPELKERSCLPAREIQSLFPASAVVSLSSFGDRGPFEQPPQVRFHQEPRGEAVDVRVGLDLRRVEEQLLPAHQVCLKRSEERRV